MNNRLDPIAELMQEHIEILSQLKKLNNVTSQLSVNGYSSENYQQIKSILILIDNEVSVHNRKEEELLFPLLEQWIMGSTLLLKQDHRELKRAYWELTQATDNFISYQQSSFAVGHLRRVSQRLIHIFVNHMYRENFILFPAIRRILKTSELREIAQKMVAKP